MYVYVLSRCPDYKNHNDLPLARIKRIMKSDEDVKMISAEAPVLFAKACELFILDMGLRFVEEHSCPPLPPFSIALAVLHGVRGPCWTLVRA